MNLESRTDATPTLRVIPRDQHIISRKNISKAALRVLYRLNEAGYAAYLVGGAVRDLLLGLRPKDFDVATDATPDEVKKLFRNCRLIGRRFRLAHVVFGPEIIEVATFRGTGEEGGEGDRHIVDGRIVRDNIWGTIEEDAIRRDFRVNAMYYDISDFSVRDYVGGTQDLEDRVLRLIGDPDTRYHEDPVRMLRAARLAAKLGMRIDAAAMAPFETLGPLLADAAPARLFDESLKMFLAGNGLKSFRMLEQCGLLKFLFPATARALRRGDEALRALVEQGLANTDARIAEGQVGDPGIPVRGAAVGRGARRGAPADRPRRRGQRGMVARCGPGGRRAVPAGGDPAPVHLHHGRDLVASAALRADPAQAGIPPDGAPALSRRVRLPAAARQRIAGDARAGPVVGACAAVAAGCAGGCVAGRWRQRRQRSRAGAGGRQAAATAPAPPPARRQVGFGVTLAYVALGSNLGNPRQQLLDAMDALASLPDIRLLQRSPLYRTPPWGVLEQPAFLNAAVELDTALSPHALLDALLAIELRAGRVRAERNGPRTLDLDLLHVDGVQLDDPQLTLPHPRMAERAFVLLPLHDIAPTLRLSGQATVAELLARLDLTGCERVA